jgi:hypothetical protein
MEILAKVASALQGVFGPLAQQAADECAVIQRQRKFTARSLARTFVLGFLQHPHATDEPLAQLAGHQGLAVTPQAIEQRHTPRLVAFLRALFVKATRVVVGSQRALAPLLERSRRVVVLDRSTITLPDELAEEFAGCGGSYGGGAAALQLQTEVDLRSDAITHVQVEPGRCPDGATTRPQARYGVGARRITDLGSFSVVVFAAIVAAKEHFRSRLQFGTHVLGGTGVPVDLLAWLTWQAGPFVDQPVRLGRAEQLACRLIAWRLPPAQAQRRRHRLRRDHRDKYGQQPSAARLAWCDGTILVTRVPPAELTPKEAVVLYRARWQVALLFKRWKSQGLVAQRSGTTVTRQLVRLWSRLLAVLVQHWLVIAGVWGDPTKSLSKAAEAVRAFVSRLAASAGDTAALRRVLGDRHEVLRRTCRRDPRIKPGTFELLNDIERLEFC